MFPDKRVADGFAEGRTPIVKRPLPISAHLGASRDRQDCPWDRLCRDYPSGQPRLFSRRDVPGSPIV